MKVTDTIVETLSTAELVGFCKGSAILSITDGDLERAIGFLRLAQEASEPEQPEEAEPEEKPRRKGRRKKEKAEEAPKRERIDHDKIIALYKAQWPIAEIAAEMNISDQTVRNHIKQELKKHSRVVQEEEA